MRSTPQFAPGSEPKTALPLPLRYGRPAWFDAVGDECRSAREDVVVFDQTSFAKLLVEGADAEPVLERLCANKVALPPGRIVYTGMLNERGGYESDLTVMRLGRDRYLVITGTAQPIRDRDWIRRNLSDGERVTISDVSGATAVLSLMGPKARQVLAPLTTTDLSLEAFQLFTSREIPLGPYTVRAARLSYIGELGWELYVPAAMAVGVYDLVMEAGRKHGIRNAGMYALTSLRIEKGYRAWGHDVTPDDTPLEAGLAFATKLDSEIPFNGRDALLRLREAGIERRLVHLMLDDPAVFPLGDEPIVRDGKIIGQVTSAAFGYSLGRAVAMGYVRLDRQDPHQLVEAGGFEIELARERFAATVSLTPYFDPKGARMRA